MINVQKALKQLIGSAKIQSVSVALVLPHLLHNDYDIRTIQELLGYKYVKTTMIYTYSGSRRVRG